MIRAMSLCICIFVVTGCDKKQEQTLKIDSTTVTVYKDHSVDDLNGELNDPENYTYFFEGEKKFIADQGTYYKFWIKANPNLKLDEFSNGESSYMVKDLGQYADHWIYFSNPFGNHSQNCMLGFYQGELSDEDVEKALRSLNLLYVYKDKNNKNCDCAFSIDDNASIEYIDYNTLE